MPGGLLATPRDQSAGEVKHGEVVLEALLSAAGQAAKAVGPGVGALDDPAPRAKADFAGERQSLFAASA